MDEKFKVKSVLDLGKYKIGDTPFWVVINHPGYKEYQPSEDDAWVLDHHPKTLYDRKLSNLWDVSQFGKRTIPKLHALDFQCVLMVITGKFMVGQYKIENIGRSSDTGEYYYMNSEGCWMPQAFLFDSEQAAYREKNRILSMISQWVNNHE